MALDKMIVALASASPEKQAAAARILEDKPEESQKLLKAGDVQKRLCISGATLMRMKRRGLIRSVSYPIGGERYRESDVARLMAGGKKVASDAAESFDASEREEVAHG